VRRAFAAHGPEVTASQVYDWCFRDLRQRRSQLNRRRVWQLLREIAEPAGRADTIGRPWLWRLKQPEAEIPSAAED
jgi:hypothetical protein